MSEFPQVFCTGCGVEPSQIIVRTGSYERIGEYVDDLKSLDGVTECECTRCGTVFEPVEDGD